MRVRLFAIPWWDLLIASLFVAAALAEVDADPAADRPIADIVAIAFAASMALRTRAPKALAVCSSAGLVLLPHSVDYLWVRSLLALTPQPAGSDPQPGLDRLPDLVRTAGAELVVRGAEIPITAGVSLAAFRLVQEALTNARRHAPGQQPTVTIAYLADGVQVSIENAGPPSRAGLGGRGLVGMAERVAIHSGDLQVGPGPDGRGWAVHARFLHAGAEVR
jgi:hypothetical protein